MPNGAEFLHDNQPGVWEVVGSDIEAAIAQVAEEMGGTSFALFVNKIARSQESVDVLPNPDALNVLAIFDTEAPARVMGRAQQISAAREQQENAALEAAIEHRRHASRSFMGKIKRLRIF